MKTKTKPAKRDVKLSNVGGSGHIVITENDNAIDLAMTYCETNGLDIDVEGPNVARQIQAKQLSLLRWKLSSTRKSLRKATGRDVKQKFMHAVNLLQRTQHDKKKQSVKIADLRGNLHAKTEELVTVLSDFESYKTKTDVSLLETKSNFEKYKRDKEKQILDFEEKSIEQMQKVVMEGSNKETDIEIHYRIQTVRDDCEKRIRAVSKDFEQQLDETQRDNNATVAKLQREKKMTSTQMTQMERQFEELQLNKQTELDTLARKVLSLQTQVDEAKKIDVSKDIRLAEMSAAVKHADKLREEATMIAESLSMGVGKQSALEKLAHISHQAAELAVTSALEDAAEMEENRRQAKDKKHAEALLAKETTFTKKIEEMRLQMEMRVHEETDKAEKRVEDAEKHAATKVRDAQSSFAKRRSSVAKQKEDLRKSSNSEKTEMSNKAEEQMQSLRKKHMREIAKQDSQHQQMIANVAELTEALEEQHKIATRFEHQIEELQTKIVATTAENEKKIQSDKDAFKSMRLDKMMIEDQAKELKLRIESLQDDKNAMLEKLEGDAESAELAIAAAGLAIESAKQQEEELRNNFLTEREKNKDQTDELRALEMNLVAVRKDYELTVESNVELKKKVAIMKVNASTADTTKRLQAELTEVRSEFKSKFEVLKQDLSSRAAHELKQALKGAKDEAEAMETRANIVKRKYEKQLHDILIALNKANEQIATFKLETEAGIVSSNAELSLVKKEAARQVSDVMKEMRAMEDDHAQELAVVGRDLEDAQRTLESLTDEHKAVHVTLKDQQQSHAKAKKGQEVAKKLFNTVQAQHKEETDAHERTKDRHAKMLAQLQNGEHSRLVELEETNILLKTRIVDEGNKKKTLELLVISMKASQEEVLKTHDKRIKEISQSLESAKSAVNTLNDEKMLVQQQCSDLKHENADIKSSSTATIIAAKSAGDDLQLRHDAIIKDRERGRLRMLELEKNATDAELAVVSEREEMREKMKKLIGQHIAERATLLKTSDISHSEALNAFKDAEAKCVQISVELEKVRKELSKSNRATELSKRLIQRIREQHEEEKEQTNNEHKRQLDKICNQAEHDTRTLTKVKANHVLELKKNKKKLKKAEKEKSEAIMALTKERGAHKRIKLEYANTHKTLEGVQNAHSKIKNDKEMSEDQIAMLKAEHAAERKKHQIEMEAVLAEAQKHAVTFQQQSDEHIFAKRTSKQESIEHKAQHEKLRAHVFDLETELSGAKIIQEELQAEGMLKVESLAKKYKNDTQLMQEQHASTIASMIANNAAKETSLHNITEQLHTRLKKLAMNNEAATGNAALKHDALLNEISTLQDENKRMQELQEDLSISKGSQESAAATHIRQLTHQMGEEKRLLAVAKQKHQDDKVVLQELREKHKEDINRASVAQEVALQEMQTHLDNTSDALGKMQEKYEKHVVNAREETIQLKKDQLDGQASQIEALRSMHVAQVKKLKAHEKLVVGEAEKKIESAQKVLRKETGRNKKIEGELKTAKSTADQLSHKVEVQSNLMESLKSEHVSSLAKMTAKSGIKLKDLQLELQHVKQALTKESGKRKKQEQELMQTNLLAQSMQKKHKTNNNLTKKRHDNIIAATTTRNQSKLRAMLAKISELERSLAEEKKNRSTAGSVTNGLEKKNKELLTNLERMEEKKLEVQLQFQVQQQKVNLLKQEKDQLMEKLEEKGKSESDAEDMKAEFQALKDKFSNLEAQKANLARIAAEDVQTAVSEAVDKTNERYEAQIAKLTKDHNKLLDIAEKNNIASLGEKFEERLRYMQNKYAEEVEVIQREHSIELRELRQHVQAELRSDHNMTVSLMQDENDILSQKLVASRINKVQVQTNQQEHEIKLQEQRENIRADLESTHNAAISLLQQRNDILTQKVVDITTTQRTTRTGINEALSKVKKERTTERKRINRELSRFQEMAEVQKQSLLNWKAKAESLRKRAKKAEGHVAEARQIALIQTRKHLERAISEYSATNEARIEHFKLEERKLRQDMQKKSDTIILELRLLLAEKVATITSAEQVTKHKLDRAQHEIEHLTASEAEARSVAASLNAARTITTTASPILESGVKARKKEWSVPGNVLNELQERLNKAERLHAVALDQSNIVDLTSAAQDVESAKDALLLYERTRIMFSDRLDALLNEIDRLKGTLPQGRIPHQNEGQHYWHGCVKCQRQVHVYQELLEKSLDASPNRGAVIYSPYQSPSRYRTEPPRMPHTAFSSPAITPLPKPEAEPSRHYFQRSPRKSKSPGKLAGHFPLVSM